MGKALELTVAGTALQDAMNTTFEFFYQALVEWQAKHSGVVTADHDIPGRKFPMSKDSVKRVDTRSVRRLRKSPTDLLLGANLRKRVWTLNPYQTISPMREEEYLCATGSFPPPVGRFHGCR